ncbi:MAG: hypothetical protein IKQ09_09855 [Bacteroidales bacterium]|nr:hypothetical protein [Bacteroidales bacterium]
MIKATVDYITNPNKLLFRCFVNADLIGKYKTLAYKLVPSLLYPFLLQPSFTKALHPT